MKLLSVTVQNKVGIGIKDDVLGDSITASKTCVGFADLREFLPMMQPWKG